MIEAVTVCLSEAERLRYSRHLMLPSCGELGQLRLKASTVSVIGAGGLGCAALTAIVTAGVGRVVIFDFDHVSLSNLHRQPLYTERDIGQSKAEVAARALQALNPHVEVIPIQSPILPESQLSAEACTLLSESELLLDCTDRFDARQTISRWAHKLMIPHCYGAVSDAEGQVALFTPQSACLGCLFPQVPPSGVIQSCAQAGVLGVAPQVIGSLQASLTLHYLIDRSAQTSPEGVISSPSKRRAAQLTQVSLSPLMTYPLSVSPRAECSLCAQEESKQPRAIPISIEGMKRRVHEGWRPRVIDVRSPEERAFGMLPGATSLNLQELNEQHKRLEDLSRHTPERFAQQLSLLEEHLLYSGDLLIYCERGPRAERAASIMSELRELASSHGLKQTGSIYELVGGYSGWSEAQ